MNAEILKCFNRVVLKMRKNKLLQYQIQNLNSLCLEYSSNSLQNF